MDVSKQPVRAITPLGDKLRFSALDVREELSRPYVMDLAVLSESADLAFDDLLGQPAGVELDLARGGQRYFHGLITDFAQIGGRGALNLYRMQLRPWLWFL
ncbi:MAG: contractile injection system protein, VgrG/Pvc8 family, partial [Pseudomonadota bacterium]